MEVEGGVRVRISGKYTFGICLGGLKKNSTVRITSFWPKIWNRDTRNTRQECQTTEPQILAQPFWLHGITRPSLYRLGCLQVCWRITSSEVPRQF